MFEALSTESKVAIRLQTGHACLVAVDGETVVGAVEWWIAEDIASFELLCSVRAGAGRSLVTAVEILAQDEGARLSRCEAPAGDILEDYFSWLGYLPVASETRDGTEWLTFERRLPLLTIREQRRSDAQDIAAMTGRDAYPFEMSPRRGCFVASDGEQFVGVAWLTGEGSEGRVEGPWLLPAYEGRGLEQWFLRRLAYHARHGGYHTVRVGATDALVAIGRELEDLRYFRSGEDFVCDLAAVAAGADDPYEEAPEWEDQP